MPLNTVTVASGGLEQSLVTILPFRNCTGPVVLGLGEAGFGGDASSSSSSLLLLVTLAVVAGEVIRAPGVLAAPAGAAFSPARWGRTPYFCSVSKSSSCRFAAVAAALSEDAFRRVNTSRARSHFFPAT